MIISRTPLRISFCGGGSDLPDFYRRFGGAVLSMSIARYIYLSMHEYFQGSGYILKYSQLETPDSVEHIRHRIIREVFGEYGIDGVDFNSSADVPAGTGLGSSSAFTVGLLNLCNAYLGRYESAATLAARACEIEIDRLGEPIGKQDQFGCALGGLNFIEFHTDDSVTYEAVPLTLAMRQRMERNLVMFYLGGTRSASDILRQQSKDIGEKADVTDNLRHMAQLARDLRRDVIGDVDAIGHYLHENWVRKKELNGNISNGLIDDAYARALAAGATGGKLLGAGASGFLLIYAPDEARERTIAALSEFTPYDVRYEPNGTTIIYSD